MNFRISYYYYYYYGWFEFSIVSRGPKRTAVQRIAKMASRDTKYGNKDEFDIGEGRNSRTCALEPSRVIERNEMISWLRN